jgi:hypothetical protein
VLVRAQPAHRVSGILVPMCEIAQLD